MKKMKKNRNLSLMIFYNMKYIATYIIILSVYLFISISPIDAKVFESGAKTNIQAQIEQRTEVRIFGYTSPNSTVQATGIRVFAQVYSEKDGYFVINSLPLSKEAKEICLTTIDSGMRTGLPLCINLPETDKPTEIGPLLLSPTLSLASAKILEKQTVAVLGKSIPDTDVVVSFFEVRSNTLAFDKFLPAIARAEAADLPRVYIKTDKRGNFSINIPTGKISAYRFFAKAYFKDTPTIKSQTLAYNVNSAIELWWRYFLPRLILLLLLLMLFTIYLYYEYRTKWLRRKFNYFIENRWKPFAVKRHLELRRLSYTVRERLRSSRR